MYVSAEPSQIKIKKCANGKYLAVGWEIGKKNKWILPRLAQRWRRQLTWMWKHPVVPKVWLKVLQGRPGEIYAILSMMNYLIGEKKYRGYFWLRIHFNVLLIKTKGFLRFTLESSILCRVNTQNKFYWQSTFCIFNIYLLTYMCIRGRVCHVCIDARGQGGQKQVVDLLELELQAVWAT